MKWRLLACVVVCLMLLSCTPATSYELFNNTDSDIQITWGFRKFSAASHSTVRIYGSGDSSDLIIESGRNIWKYAPPPFFISWHPGSWQDKYISQGFPAGYIIKAQIEVDGKIYIVPKSESLPTKVSNQPGPFPLVPTVLSEAVVRDSAA